LIAESRDYDADVIAPWTGKLTQFPSIARMIRNGYDILGTFDTPNTVLPRGVYRERED
jgi:hypothetical protein